MITCQVETFEAAVDGIAQLIDEQWLEVGSWRDRFTRSIHFEDYRLLERNGRLITVTSRTEAHDLVGYFVGVVGNDLHRNSRLQPDKRVAVVSALVYYMAPKYRGYGRSLIHCVERHAVERYNVEIVNIRVKPDANEAGAFLALLGYTVTEVTYTRLLGEASDARFRERTEPLGSVLD